MSELDRLLEIMRRLRSPDGGCPWDLEQDFASIAPCTVEEAYEVADAIERGDMGRLSDELGDLLLQVVFHAQMASEQGLFDFTQVARGISDKLVRRHPHIFGDASVASAEEQTRAWERQKAEERRAQRQGVLEDVPYALPALRRAEKLGRCAATVGFDWPDAAAVRDKLAEELAELEQELGAGETAARERVAAELGDVFFVLANLARHLHIDPEAALQASNARFVRRFSYIEERLREAGREPAEASLAEMDRLWDEAKAQGD